MADAEKDEVRAALERAIGFQYEIVRMLGRGGMGAVYQAHERALDRPVAIKVLPPEVAGTEVARERFLREARTAARLTHPNIVPLFTFGEAGGLIYYVMGYVEGESLQQRLDRAGKLDATRATRILEQLANALDYAHAQGIVHRDVKPDNILLERGTGDAKLTDFGIAKRAAGGETLTGTGLLMGTPRYMSPEQASGDRDLDARSDVYSLGLVGYAMLTGRPPFDGASVQDTLRQQVMRDAPSLRKLLPDAPSALVFSVDRALAKDPKDRWQSAGTMAGAINDEEVDDVGIGKRGRRPGVYAITTAISALVAFNMAWFFASRAPWLATLVAVWIPAGALIDYLSARFGDKKSPGEIRKMFTLPPRWWAYWWPRQWRRADDIWDRLPHEVRETRIIASLGIGCALLAFESTFLGLTAAGRIPRDWITSWVNGSVAAMVGTLGLLVLSAVRAERWGRKAGLTQRESLRFANESTARPRFWAQSQIARLLTDEPDFVAGEPRTHEEHVNAIAAGIAALPEHREALDAARRIATAIDALDGDIANLAREADPAEVARLQQRLEAPGNEEMRKLYASQLELLRRLDTQRADAESRRARYTELLRTLWLQVASLRAQVAADNAQATELSGRIRAICRSVEHEVEGMREAAAVIRPL
jgi:hypothetical protein